MFTAPPAARGAVKGASIASQTTVTCIGRIEAERGVRIVDAQGEPMPLAYASFDHFA